MSPVSQCQEKTIFTGEPSELYDEEKVVAHVLELLNHEDYVARELVKQLFAYIYYDRKYLVRAILTTYCVTSSTSAYSGATQKLSVYPALQRQADSLCTVVASEAYYEKMVVAKLLQLLNRDDYVSRELVKQSFSYRCSDPKYVRANLATWFTTDTSESISTNEASKAYDEEKVVAQLLDLLNRDDYVSRELVKQLFAYMAFKNEASSRAAQSLFMKITQSDRFFLATGLKGKVLAAVTSYHAYHVVKKILETMPLASVSFIVVELMDSALKVACHSVGCRALCRILEHLTDDEMTIQLFDDILGIKSLFRKQYGTYVARHLLEFGLPHHKQRVAIALSTDLTRYSMDRFGSLMVQDAMTLCTEEDKCALARKLLSDEKNLIKIAKGFYGCHVVCTLLGMEGELKKHAVQTLCPKKISLTYKEGGKKCKNSKVLKELEEASRFLSECMTA